MTPRKTPRSSAPSRSPKSQRSALPRVAFLGLGSMGAPMAANLVRAGFHVSVWNRTAKRAAALVKLGATQAGTPEECARGADVIVTMVSDAGALDAILFGRGGALGGMKKKALVIDMSTIGRADAVRMAKAVAGAGGRFVDAPVSGTVAPAERGELLALVGGGLKDVEDARVVLKPMCNRMIHAGGVGQGQALKVVLNGVGSHHFVAFTSMLVLGEKAGLTRQVLVDTFTSGAFASPSYLGKRAKVMARDYSAEFSLALTKKDARLNVELQNEVGVTLPVMREIARAIDSAVDAGLGEEDLYALEKYYAELFPPPAPSTRGASRAPSIRPR